MTGHTSKGVPYALPSDALTDYPAASLELANLAQSLEVVAFTLVTASVHITNAAEATADVVATLPAFTAGGSESYWIEFQAVGIFLPANCALNGWLFDGANSQGRLFQAYNVAPGGNWPVRLSTPVTPTAGAHTYSVRASQQFGACDVIFGPGGAGNWRPGYLLARRAL